MGATAYYNPKPKTVKNEVTPEEITLADGLMTQAGMDREAAYYCAEMVKVLHGKDKLVEKIEAMRKDGKTTVSQIIAYCQKNGWIDQHGKVSPLDDKYKGTVNETQVVPEQHQTNVTPIHNGKSNQVKRNFDQTKIFGRKGALTVSLAEKDGEPSSIMFTFAEVDNKKDKVNGMSQFNWQEGIRFSMSAEEAVALLLVLQGKRNLLRNIAGQDKDGIFHQNNGENKTINAKVQENGVYISIHAGRTIGIPIGAGDRLRLSAYVMSRVKRLEPYTGLSGAEIMALAHNTI